MTSHVFLSYDFLSSQVVLATEIQSGKQYASKFKFQVEYDHIKMCIHVIIMKL